MNAVDAHCHLNFHSFHDDADSVIKEAQQAGVVSIINAGTKIESSQQAVELADKHTGLFAAAGIHPHHADKVEKGWEDKLVNLAKHKKVVAIGEIGMDYFHYKSNGIVDPNIQRDVFETQLEIANALGLPLQIHNRHAEKDIYEILSSHKNLLQNNPGMVHCFSGSLDFLKNVLGLGFSVGFDGNITYDGLAPGETTDLKDLVKYAPVDRILTETDSPYLTPVPFRGARNCPKHAIIVGTYIADLKQRDYEEFADQVQKNFIASFPKTI